MLSLSCGWDPVTGAWLVGHTKVRRGQQRWAGSEGTATLAEFVLNKMLAALYLFFKMPHTCPLLPLCLIFTIIQPRMKMAPIH